MYEDVILRETRAQKGLDVWPEEHTRKQTLAIEAHQKPQAQTPMPTAVKTHAPSPVPTVLQTAFPTPSRLRGRGIEASTKTAAAAAVPLAYTDAASAKSAQSADRVGKAKSIVNIVYWPHDEANAWAWTGKFECPRTSCLISKDRSLLTDATTKGFIWQASKHMRIARA
jgi:hypothetical protein